MAVSVALAELLSMAHAVPSVTLAWDANAEPDVAGYKLHYGTSSGAYTQIIDVGNATTVTVPNLPAGNTYYFVVTAYNLDGIESLPSNEASCTQQLPQEISLATQVIDLADAAMYVPMEPELPGTTSVHSPHLLSDGSYEFAVKGTAGGSLSIFASSDLTTWTLLGSVPNPTGVLLVKDFEAFDNPHRFYRVLGN
jgi:Fibronectin type III domain